MDAIDKPLFGAYLNMARHNLLMVINHIEEKVLCTKGKWKDDQLLSSPIFSKLEGNKEPDVQKRIIDMLQQHLPFLRLMIKNAGSASPADYAAVIKNVIHHLFQYRFFYCHHLHERYTTDVGIIESLRYLFDAGRRRVKLRFSLADAEVQHLIRKTFMKENGKRIVAEKRNFHYAFAAENFEINEKGLAFFVCLFLEKKYAFLFLKQLKGFKDSRTNAGKATLQTFTFFGIRVPQPRIVSDNTPQGLMMDIIEELKRCPSSLFDLLSKEDQNKFRVVPERDEEELEAEVLQKRFGDRFPYLALRYLELTNGIKDIKFHTDLGKFNFKIYTKEVNGEQRIRQLYKHMKGIGHLQDFEEERMPDDWNKLVKRSDELPEDYSEPHIVYTYPHYHFLPNHNIGLSIINNPVYPSVNRDIKVEPKVWLSLYELPALMFLHLLTVNKGGISDVKRVLHDHIRNINNFFKAFTEDKIALFETKEELQQELKKTYNLELDNIPTVLVEYLLQKSPMQLHAKAKKKLKRMLEETNFLLERLEKDLERSREKAGSKRFKVFQTGKLADFLARDMMLFQPAVDTIKGKATGSLFQVLQARLAYYGRDKNLLLDLYKECNLIASDNPHPFLQDLPIVNNMVDYYKNYLNRRKTYLEKMKEKCMKGKINSNGFHFLHFGERERRQEKAYYINVAKKFMEKPINFPRGLFMEAIKKHLGKRSTTPIKELVNNNERVNTIYLLQQYLTTLLQDASQPFYDWRKNYFFIDKLYDKRHKNSREQRQKSFLTTQELATKQKELKNTIKQLAAATEEEKIHKIIAEKEYNHFTENEKKLRHTKACDIVLFLMVKRIMTSLENTILQSVDINSLKLQDISPLKETGILSTRIKIKLPLYKRYIEQDNLKLKNYGDFRRFLKDNRLDNLLKFYPEGTVMNRIDLERELEWYDKARIEVQRLILNFEKEVSEKYSNHLSMADADKHYIPFEKILSKLEYKEGSNPNSEKMRLLRNAFMHNEYPDSAVFASDIDIALPITVAEQLLNKAKECFFLPVGVPPNEIKGWLLLTHTGMIN